MILPSRVLIPLVHAALNRGQNVRLTVKGDSMIPFIHNGDLIELEPIRSNLSTSDIVLAKTANGYFVLHRIVHIKDENVWLRGDSQNYCEGPIARKKIIGRAIKLSHEGFNYSLNHGLLRIAGFIWMKMNLVRFFFHHIVSPCYRFMRKTYHFIKRIIN